MKVKTSDLIGPALDWAVCVAEGNSPIINPFRYGATRFGMVDSPHGYTIKEYSTDWAHGGPIIEQEKIKLDPRKGQWEATIWNEAEMQNPAYGPMILVAAMRCFCCSKLGDVVDIPEGTMPAAKQLDGQVFGRLTVLNRSGNLNGRVLWACRCACGKLHKAVSHALTSGHTKSCGCWKDERNTSTPPIHEHASRTNGISPTYRTWQAMITRCTNDSDKSYQDYGARGISVCTRWLVFENFLTDMGAKPPGMSIERMDNEKSYEPGNCKWATKIEQARNTRANKFVSYKGTRMTQAEFAEATGHSQSTVSYRLRSGWTPEQVASTPPHTGNRVASKLGDEVEVPDKLGKT